MGKIYEFFGGRKQTNGYLFVVVLTAAAAFIFEDANFVEYAGFLVLGLLGTSAAVAYEDARLGRP